MNDVAWRLSEGGALLGLCLGHDFVAEHEVGLGPLTRRFGIEPGTPRGLADRKAKRVPERMRFERFVLTVDGAKYNAALLVVGCDTGGDTAVQLLKRYELTPWGITLTAAWDEGSFAVCAVGEKDVGRLEQLRKAIQDLDVLIAPSGGKAWMRSGFNLILDSKVSEEDRAAVLASDLDHIRMKEVAAATGIEGRLRKAGREFFALSPAWADETKTSVTFWLNPMHQRQNNFGWFTVEQLDQWIAGEGPIPVPSRMANAR